MTGGRGDTSLSFGLRPAWGHREVGMFWVARGTRPLSGPLCADCRAPRCEVRCLCKRARGTMMRPKPTVHSQLPAQRKTGSGSSRHKATLQHVKGLMHIQVLDTSPLGSSPLPVQLRPQTPLSCAAAPAPCSALSHPVGLTHGSSGAAELLLIAQRQAISAEPREINGVKEK